MKSRKPALITLDGQTTRIENVDLAVEDGGLKLNGTVAPDAMELAATIDSLPLSLARAVAPDLKITGRLNGEVALSGTHDRAERTLRTHRHQHRRQRCAGAAGRPGCRRHARAGPAGCEGHREAEERWRTRLHRRLAEPDGRRATGGARQRHLRPVAGRCLPRGRRRPGQRQGRARRGRRRAAERARRDRPAAADRRRLRQPALRHQAAEDRGGRARRGAGASRSSA